MMLTIYCNPSFNPFYYSYYLLGLQANLETHVRYTLSRVPSFGHDYLSLECPEQRARIVIDANDSERVHAEAFQWSTIYAKVNTSIESLTIGGDKIVPIGPGFGIRHKIPVSCPVTAARRAMFERGPRTEAAWLAMKMQLWHLQRPPLTQFSPGFVEEGYVFFISSIWAPADRCNEMRRRFIEVCRRMTQFRFEGGFVPPTRNDVTELIPYVLNRRYSVKEYIEKTKKSQFVFNTPAVQDCHGWKLAEYLSMGKAIISTPLTRLMPAPIVHGCHIYCVDDTSEQGIANAVNRLVSDSQLRRYLEVQAREYYIKHLTPGAVMKRILGVALNGSASLEIPV